MNTVTLQTACPLWGCCLYPHTKRRYFRNNVPCNNGSRCGVEIATQEVQQDSASDLVRIINPLTPQSHWVAIFEDAAQLERNTERGLPWNCGCELCASGNWVTCYGKTGPDSKLRSFINTSGYTPPWQSTAPKQTAEADEAQAP